jgi:hypothetical protein
LAVRPESFGPADWDVEFVDPACIFHGSRVRPVRKEGGDLLVDSIRRTGWDPTSLVVLYRYQDQVIDSHTPQRFLCLDGMHRVRAVRQLLDEKHSDWPSDWVDAGDGDVRMRCQGCTNTHIREYEHEIFCHTQFIFIFADMNMNVRIFGFRIFS